MDLYDWEGAISAWVARRRSVPAASADAIVAFFRQAFDHTVFPDRSWFGAHQQVVSLVVGNIWLASINLGTTDRGVWALLSKSPGQIAGWRAYPTRSTLGSLTPLTWGHTEDVACITEVLQHDAFWQCFAEASRDVFNASTVAGDRDETQLRRGKVRLSDFWNPSEMTNALLKEREIALQITRSNPVSPFATEKAFEEAAILPLVESLGWQAQREYTFSIPVGGKTLPVRADMLVTDEHGPLTIIENKLQILSDRDLEFARGQARSYASALELSSFIVAAPQGVWVYIFERGKVKLIQKFEHTALRQHPEELQNLLQQVR